jgi:tetratricopeptide (TPR) repeat protein
MIERDYMVVDGRRDHSFRIPRPDLSLETRSPNACTDCHGDQSAAWAAEVLEAWFPDSAHRGPHFGQTLAAARNDLRGTAADLAAIALYREIPGIARATALEMLHNTSSPALATELAPLLEDPDPMVRAAAVGVQRGAAEALRANRLAPLLSDPVKAVRIATAREFLGLPGARLTPRAGEALQFSMREWQDSLLAKADFPETQLVVAGIGLTTRRMDTALRAFEEAVTLDPQLEEGWVMMVRIHAALGNIQAARDVADRAVEANPESIPLSLLRSDLN